MRQNSALRGYRLTNTACLLTGKTNSVSIVTKLEDDEQMETGLTESNQISQSNRTTIQDFYTCEGKKALKYKMKNKCKPTSKLCQFTRLILKNSSQMSFEYESKNLLVKGLKKLDDPDLEATESLIQSENNQFHSDDVTLSVQKDESKTEDQSFEVTQTTEMRHSSRKDSESVYHTTAATETMQNRESLTFEDIGVAESKTTEISSPMSYSEHSSVMEASTQIDAPKPSLSESKTNLEFSKAETTIFESHVTETLDTVYINPSPTAATSDMTGTSPKQEPTPSLPESWKPDTKDVMETGTQSVIDSLTQTVDKFEKVMGPYSVLPYSFNTFPNNRF